ncbi:MAG TPA: hypothetical protein VIF60_03210 [Burkholderiaceae bacterium]|jgi:hypothetical protein
MNPLQNIIRPKPRRTALLWLASLVLLALAAGAGTLAYMRHQSVEQFQALRTALAAQQAAQVVPAPNQQEQMEQKKWAQLRLERDFPWNGVFKVVEKVATPDIELLEFRPDKLNRTIVLKGEARNLAALLAYLDALGNQSGWSKVFLAHQQTVQRGTLETISFEIKGTLPD